MRQCYLIIGIRILVKIFILRRAPGSVFVLNFGKLLSKQSNEQWNETLQRSYDVIICYSRKTYISSCIHLRRSVIFLSASTSREKTNDVTNFDMSLYLTGDFYLCAIYIPCRTISLEQKEFPKEISSRELRHIIHDQWCEWESRHMQTCKLYDSGSDWFGTDKKREKRWWS